MAKGKKTVIGDLELQDLWMNMQVEGTDEVNGDRVMAVDGVDIHQWAGDRWHRDGCTDAHIADSLHSAIRNDYPNGVAVARRARSAIAASVRVPRSQVDSDINLLGLIGCTLDIKSMKLRKPSKGDYITRRIEASPLLGEDGLPVSHNEYIERLENSEWIKRLREWMDDDDDELRDRRIEMLQKMCGYFLTGDVSLHLIFVMTGLTRNGKSVFMNVIKALLGGYAKTIPKDTFIGGGDEHPAKIAELQGIRLAAVSEAEKDSGRSFWRGGTFKGVSGGDDMTGRFMGRDWFEFTPQCKIVVVANNLPDIRQMDAAIIERLVVVPWSTYIPKANRIKDLDKKLIANERDLIMHWCIEGLRKFQADGFSTTEVEDKALKDYTDAQDKMGVWMRDNCRIESTGIEEQNVLFEDCEDYFKKQWGIEITKNGFSRQFNGTNAVRTGLITRKDTRRSGSREKVIQYYGIKLKTDAELSNEIDTSDLPEV